MFHEGLLSENAEGVCVKCFECFMWAQNACVGVEKDIHL